LIDFIKHFLLVIATFCSACSVQHLSNTTISAEPTEVLLKHLYYLSSDNLQGRRVGTKGNELARKYIVNHLEKHNIKPLGSRYLSAFTISSPFKLKQGNNVVGFIEGTEFPDKFLVLSAHFDHIGARGRNIYNGADDNASGTSALLDYAKRLQQAPLRHSVILLFTDGEETNLKGAKAFIAQNPSLLASIVLNINLDMIGGSKTTKKLHYVSRRLEQVLSAEKILSLEQQNYAIVFKKGFRQSINGRKKNIRWELASDHGVFYRQKIPFIYYGVGLHRNYHQSTDTYQNINHRFFMSAVALIFHQISFIDENL